MRDDRVRRAGRDKRLREIGGLCGRAAAAKLAGMRFVTALFAGMLLGISALAAAPAETLPGKPAETPKKKLVVGTREAPPFAMKGADGEWSGLSINLWRNVAEDLGVDFEFRELGNPDSLVKDVADGAVDLSVSAVSVTADRARKVDFSQSYYSSGYGIVVPVSKSSGWWSTVRGFFSLGFLKVVTALALVLLVAATTVWLFERRANAEQFGGTAARGLGAAFWWSAVTMTTVGYGDKAPETVGGRLVGLIWMFVSVVIISGFTAQIAASLTAHRLDSEIRGPADLRTLAVACVSGSSAETYLSRRGIRTVGRTSVDDLLVAVESGEADAGVYDAPLLKYMLRHHSGLRMLPGTFESWDYAIVLPLDSDLRKDINIAVLENVQGDQWRMEIERYLGPH